MSKIFTSVGMSAAFAVAGILSGEAAAMPLGGSGKVALERIDLIAQAQYSYGGKDYCWYDDGWNGPGWYVCGQYTVRGVGWGGGAGWHGWVHTGGTTRRGAAATGGGTRVSGGTRAGSTRTGSSRTGSSRTGTSTGGSRTGSTRTGGSRTGGGRSGRGRTGGGRSGGGRGGGRHSDVLLKHDITLLGRLENGLGFYRFSYNGSDKAYVGVIAQEVQAVMPAAVVRGSDGYLRVRYGALGVKFQAYERWLASGAIVPSGLPQRQ
jgi:Chaperone of endosialidase